MAIIALISFGYKLTLGILATSLVMIVAAVPSFFIFVCKASYAKNMHQTRKSKKKAYLLMAVATTCFVVVFILFSVLKVGGIDITNKNRFEDWVGIVFIAFIIIMFILSIINLKGALNRTDIVVIGMKEITFVSALADAMMIEEFIYRFLLAYLDTPYLDYVNQYFPLAIGVIMLIVPICMFRRYFKYEE